METTNITPNAGEPLNEYEVSANVPSVLEKHGLTEESPLRRSVRSRTNITYVPFLYTKGKYIPLRARHRILLDNYRPGVSLAEAANKAGMTEDQAKYFFRRPIVREYLHDLEKDVAIQQGWHAPGKWWAEGNKVWNGEKQVSKAQLAVWQEFGDRVVPKQSRSADSGPTKIEINIDPGAVQEAFRRQNAIEAEVIKGDAA